jgi:hypothetical protein
VQFEVSFHFVEGSNAAADERVYSLLSLFQLIKHFGDLKQPFLKIVHADHPVIVMWAMTTARVDVTHAGIGRAAGLRADDENRSVVSTACEHGVVCFSIRNHN